jgi:membrane protein DedA with SNARE-associated domain
MALAVLRGAVAGIAVLLAPFLYREHAAVLVLLRPTKEVFLFAGFLLRRDDITVPPVVAAALPMLVGAVWVVFGLGLSYRDDLDDAELPGLAGRLLPKERLDKLRGLLEEKGTRLVFLGRLAAFPSSLMGAAAGSSGLSWKQFVVADTAGALASLAAALGLGYGLGEAYESGGVWLTVGGVVVLVGLAVLVGRWLSRSAPATSTPATSNPASASSASPSRATTATSSSS